MRHLRQNRNHRENLPEMSDKYSPIIDKEIQNRLEAIALLQDAIAKEEGVLQGLNIAKNLWDKQVHKTCEPEIEKDFLRDIRDVIFCLSGKPGAGTPQAHCGCAACAVARRIQELQGNE